MRPKNLIPITFLGISCLAACGDEVAPLGSGAAQLTWQISPRGCDDSGVTHVEVHLDGPSTRNEIFACDASEATIDSLEPGSYKAWIEGVNESGKVIFAAPEHRLTVRADRIETVPHSRLTAKPAEFAVEWRFENGRVCGANEVTDIEVVVFDKADYEIAREVFACDEGVGTLGGFTAGTYLLEAVTMGTGARYRGLATASVDRGDLADVEVVLEEDF